jgi:adenylyl cyclase-associated protein
VPQQGDGITKGLRKVTDDMKSKNRTDRSGLVPQQAPGAAAPAAAAAPAKSAVKGTPR